MKHIIHCLTLVFTIAAAIAAPVFPPTERLMDPKNWNTNSSGEVVRSYIPEEQALQFDITFQKKIDKWAYPMYGCRRGETVSGLTAVVFDMRILSTGEPMGFKYGNVMLKGFCAFTPATDTAWHTYRVTIPNTSYWDTRFIAIGMNPTHHHLIYRLRNIRFEGTPVQHGKPQGIFADVPGNVFFEDASPTFECTVPQPGLTYAIRNWRGETVTQGIWPDDGKGKLVLRPLPPGYYIIATASKAKQQLRDYSFTVVIHPRKRVYPHDAFFGIDSAQSWCCRPGSFACPWYDGDTYRVASDLLAWAGFPHVRERFSWGECNPQQDRINYSYYMTNADYLHERGILVSGMYHDSPAWAGKDNAHDGRIPYDLLGTYRFAKHVAADFGERMGDWEFWNEQDGGFGCDAVWTWMAAFKAASLGYHAGRPGIIVAPGAICRGHRGRYDDIMYASGAAKYADVMNFHTYTCLSNYGSTLKELREFMTSKGIGDRAIWITECGTNNEGLGTTNYLSPKRWSHDPKQELIMAEFYPKSQIGHMMQGVARNYYFVFGICYERDNKKDWGMIRLDGTVKPTYAAASTMMAELITARLAGEISLHPHVKAYLFELPDGSQTLVYWKPSALDTIENRDTIQLDDLSAVTFDIPLSNGSYRLVDLVGTPSSVIANHGRLTLTADRFPAYLCGLKGLQPTVRPLPTGTPQHYQPKADEDLTIIINARFQEGDITIGDLKTCAYLGVPAPRLKLQVWNLDDTAKSGTLTVAGGSLAALPPVITIPAMGNYELDTTYTPSFEPGQETTTLVITGTFNGKTSTPFVVPVLSLYSIMQQCTMIALDTASPDGWRRNDSATETSITYDEAEKAVRFDCVWKDAVDRWFYPEHILKKPDESLKDVRILEFDVKAEQNDPYSEAWRALYAMFVHGTEAQFGTYKSIPYSSLTDTWSTKRIQLDKVPFKPEDIRQIRIGCNPNGKKLTYWIRNMRLYRSK